jgi:predicted lipid-binding transport protein (Tim44 family)
MKHFASCLFAAVSSLAAAVAIAQTPSTPGPAAPAAVQPGAPVTVAAQPVPAAKWTAQQIRQAFDAADSDNDGQLSRAEAQRLAILPRSFEDLDQNKDGVLSRSEYQAGFAP